MTTSPTIDGRELGDALATINVPMFIVDGNGSVRWTNAKSDDLFGDQRGKSFTAALAPEAAPSARVEFTKKMLGNARTSDFETVVVLQNGERVPAEIHSVSLEDGGRVIGVFGIVEVDERRRPPQNAHGTQLTPRQYEVLRLLARGSSTDQIAAALGISRETVRNHVRGLLGALRVGSRIEALAEARRRGLVD
ncbi:MAG TPA: LuxR C-terminal-related transcriptional regulator [Gaiellaceae bacterium]|nr:LuxR C-terminal-related transcriptional regulator [Gaiellaceae bacterium]